MSKSSIMIECPVECETCSLIFDGASHNDCPACLITRLQTKIVLATSFLQDDAPLHALEVLTS